MNVLIVEDDYALVRELGLYLHNEGSFCDIARTSREAAEKLFVNEYDFVLLDLGLPDQDGLHLLAEARRERNQQATIIILSARGTLDDRIRGLDLGADDYLSKPYSLLELTSRMKAITRRRHSVPHDVLLLGPFALHAADRTLRYTPTGQTVVLTRKELDLLHYLLLHRRKVLTRLQLLEHIWGGNFSDSAERDSNFIDVHVKNLRKKLAAYDSAEWIETVRGVGYRVKATPEASA